MGVPEEYRTLSGHLVRAWLSDGTGGGKFPVEYLPAYLERLGRLIERFALWSHKEGGVPTQAELSFEIEELLFLCKSADPHRRSPIYQSAAEHLKAAEAEGRRTLS